MADRIALFRADASPAIGGGHVMRCLALALELSRRGWTCLFAGAAESPNTVPAVAAEGLKWIILPIGDTAEQAAALKASYPGGVDLLIVDHYGLDARFERACRPWARRVLVIDDLADRPHDADILLDPTLGRTAADYRPHVGEAARLLLGPPYALLRRAFARERTAAAPRRDGRVRRILVSFGATDPTNATSAALKALFGATDAALDVVLGPAAPHLAAIQALARTHERVSLHIGTPSVAGLMRAADLAVGAAGSSAWERCALGLPALMIVVADNQRTISRALAAVGAAVALDRPEDLASVLPTLDDGRLSAMSRSAASICDGLGALRTVAEINPETASNGIPVHLIPAAPEHCEILLGWQRAPGVRRFARNPNPPEPDAHRRWFAARLADPRCVFSMIEHDHAPIGMLRLDRLDDVADAFEVSILVAPGAQGRGIAAAALRTARRLIPWATLHAEVLPGNTVSAKLFTATGYELVSPGHFVSRPLEEQAS